jgi:hypothetical protein
MVHEPLKTSLYIQVFPGYSDLRKHVEGRNKVVPPIRVLKLDPIIEMFIPGPIILLKEFGF